MGKPWDDAPDVWKDEKAFCQWLRSQSRRMWSRHPIKNNYVRERVVPIDKVPVGELPDKLSKQTKALCKCEMCGLYFPRSKMEVDHIVQAGSFLSVDDWQGFLQRLMVVGFSDIRLLCKDNCHAKVTLSQRYHCSIEEAEVRQKVVVFKKMAVVRQREWLTLLDLPVGTTAKARADTYLNYLLKELNNGK
jgi:hypothetical protein